MKKGGRRLRLTAKAALLPALPATFTTCASCGWLAAADNSAKVPPKLDDDKATREEAIEALRCCASSWKKAAGRVPKFKPDVLAFVGYLIAHDSHHRGQMATLARQIGAPLPGKAYFGLSEWGTLWKETAPSP
jgi:DinB family